MVTPNPHNPANRQANQDLTARFAAQLAASDSPEPVRDLTPDEQMTLAATLANVARQAGWNPSQEA